MSLVNLRNWGFAELPHLYMQVRMKNKHGLTWSAAKTEGLVFDSLVRSDFVKMDIL